MMKAIAVVLASYMPIDAASASPTGAGPTDTRSPARQTCRNGDVTTTTHLAPPASRQPHAAIRIAFEAPPPGRPDSELQFRDLYGRLVFAMRTTDTSTLRVAFTGPDADDPCLAPAPVWRSVDLRAGVTYRLRVDADFATGIMDFAIDAPGAAPVVQWKASTHAKGLERAVATVAPGGTPIAMPSIRTWGPAPPAILAGRTIHAFGDSIVAGHLYQRSSFADLVARQEGMLLVKRAVNGATVLPGPNAIADQLASAPAAVPDFVLFDGGVNDAYPPILARLGPVTDGFAAPSTRPPSPVPSNS